jgi:hypothetical protein
MISWTLLAVIFAVAAMVWVHGQGAAGLGWFLVGLITCLIRVGLLPIHGLGVDDAGVTLTRSTLLGVRTRTKRFAAEDVRRVRYRSDLYGYQDSSVDTREMRYFLDLVTVDGEIELLITSRGLALPRRLGAAVARRLGVPYEEYLTPEPW